jgi:hypothetical protein
MPDEELLGLMLWWHARYRREAPVELPPALAQVYNEIVLSGDEL